MKFDFILILILSHWAFDDALKSIFLFASKFLLMSWDINFGYGFRNLLFDFIEVKMFLAFNITSIVFLSQFIRSFLSLSLSLSLFSFICFIFVRVLLLSCLLFPSFIFSLDLFIYIIFHSHFLVLSFISFSVVFLSLSLSLSLSHS